MSHRWHSWAVPLALLTVVAAAGRAGAADYTIGLGAGFAPDYEGSDDYDAVPVWRLSASNLYHPDTHITLTGPSLRSNLVPHDQLRAGLFGRWVGERDDIDDDVVDALDDTDTALLLGGTLGWDFFAGRPLSLTAAVDMAYDVAHGNGYLITPRLTYSNAWPASRFSAAAELFTTWASGDYLSEQFGIDADESARTGLDVHDPDGSFKEVGLRLSVDYRFLDNVSATLLGAYAHLLEDAADSPIVDDRGDENQFFVGATVNYRF